LQALALCQSLNNHNQYTVIHVRTFYTTWV